MHERQQLGVIGLGYIGLPTAAIFAASGFMAHGVDVRPHVVEAVKQGRSHFSERGLNELLSKCVTEGRLTASLVPVPCDAFIIAVPTPFKGNHVPDLSYVEAATAAVAPVLRPGNLVVLESTVPVGATEALAQQLAKLRPDLRLPLSEDDDADIYVAHCPERVLPGRILEELVHNARIVGGITSRCTRKAVELYETAVQG